MSSEPGYSRQSSIRFMFRVAATGVLVLAAYFLYVGLSEFIAADDEPPQKFWMLFVGLPLVAVGLWLAGAGFGGVAARYAAGEGATGGPYCRQCGTRTDAEASFCDSCGKSLV